MNPLINYAQPWSTLEAEEEEDEEEEEEAEAAAYGWNNMMPLVNQPQYSEAAAVA